MTETPAPEQEWIDALGGDLLEILLNLMTLVGAIGIIVGLYLLVKSTPSSRVRHDRSPYAKGTRR